MDGTETTLSSTEIGHLLATAPRAPRALDDASQPHRVALEGTLASVTDPQQSAPEGSVEAGVDHATAGVIGSFLKRAGVEVSVPVATCAACTAGSEACATVGAQIYSLKPAEANGTVAAFDETAAGLVEAPASESDADFLRGISAALADIAGAVSAYEAGRNEMEQTD